MKDGAEAQTQSRHFATRKAAEAHERAVHYFKRW
jgi:hypothetical protein